jgi:hypothetical protein
MQMMYTINLIGLVTMNPPPYEYFLIKKLIKNTATICDVSAPCDVESVLWALLQSCYLSSVNPTFIPLVLGFRFHFLGYMSLRLPFRARVSLSNSACRRPRAS